MRPLTIEVLVDIPLISDPAWTPGGEQTKLTPRGGARPRVCQCWSPDSREIFYLSLSRGQADISMVPVSGAPATQVTHHEGRISQMALSPDGTRFAYTFADTGHSPDLWVIPARGGRPRQLTFSMADLDPLRPAQHLPYKSYDELYIDAYLYLPPEFEPHRKYPALVQAHGGGTNNYGNDWHPQEQYLASRGYIVLAVEYRGSSGYGRDFADLSYRDWGGGQAKDVIAAAAFLKSLEFIDGERIGIYGGSYGGYMTLHAITQSPDTFQAAVDMYGATDRVNYYENSDRLGRLFFMRNNGMKTPDEDPEVYRRASSYHRLPEIKTPLLILQGALDPRVPLVESEHVVEVLKTHQKIHEFVVYPDEAHGFRRRANRIDSLTRMEEWFHTHLKAGS